jgi:hypothetical protein
MITIDVAVEHWSDHNQAAIFEMQHGTVERAAVRATLADAAARMAQALVARDAEMTG